MYSCIIPDLTLCYRDIPYEYHTMISWFTRNHHPRPLLFFFFLFLALFLSPSLFPSLSLFLFLPFCRFFSPRAESPWIYRQLPRRLGTDPSAHPWSSACCRESFRASAWKRNRGCQEKSSLGHIAGRSYQSSIFLYRLPFLGSMEHYNSANDPWNSPNPDFSSTLWQSSAALLFWFFLLFDFFRCGINKDVFKLSESYYIYSSCFGRLFK